MPVTVFRKGFTLIELIIVLVIMGVVATFVTSRLAKKEEHSVTLTPDGIKKYLSSFNSTKKLDLFCYNNAKECDLWEDDKKIFSSIKIKSEGEIKVRRFDRQGRLVDADPIARFENGKLRRGDFEFIFYPDGVSSPLLLQVKERLYAYTPLNDSVQQGQEAQIRSFLYKQELMDRNNYYAAP